ncbi:hypothetical protein JET68_08035 [Pseudomonas monteilii]|uniref:hypothetical protein n=1 Tax=Pseudomonas TaxID=286 RepID=UPI0018E67497|nr:MULTISPECIES: hypothetical protein [Pseudomonas]MBI6918745.1 hypothetical protein [Pseudomonas monteilii]MCE0937307.1 hypothetical protein [Pseudomonas kurunegalensis]
MDVIHDIAALTDDERGRLDDWQRGFLHDIAAMLDANTPLTERQRMRTLYVIKRVKGRTR